jgi:hypothetical protein
VGLKDFSNAIGKNHPDFSRADKLVDIILSGPPKGSKISSKNKILLFSCGPDRRVQSRRAPKRKKGCQAPEPATLVVTPSEKKSEPKSVFCAHTNPRRGLASREVIVPRIEANPKPIFAAGQIPRPFGMGRPKPFLSLEFP